MNDYNEIRSFRDLLVWRKGIELTKDIYALTQRFPTGEKFRVRDDLIFLGLRSELFRSGRPSPGEDGLHVAFK